MGVGSGVGPAAGVGASTVEAGLAGGVAEAAAVAMVAGVDSAGVDNAEPGAAGAGLPGWLGERVHADSANAAMSDAAIHRALGRRGMAPVKCNPCCSVAKMVQPARRRSPQTRGRTRSDVYG